MRPVSAKDRLILAVDTASLDEARRIVDELYEYVGIFKIGLELFMNAGPAALQLFQERQSKIFFDGKFLDIPNTVAQASQAVALAGVQMFTVHASGGGAMLRACAQAVNQAAGAAGTPAPIILGVTVLTSMDQASLNEELNISGSVDEQVLSLAGLCRASGVTGLVASAQEVAQLRTTFGDSFILVTPGVRPVWAAANDQSRVVTPAQALRNGSDYLVIGRPILAAPDRRQAAQRILAEMEDVC